MTGSNNPTVTNSSAKFGAESSVVFQSAVEHVRKAKSMKSSDSDKLQFYSLFKQATEGDCRSPAPSRFSVVQYAKWKAWHDLRGMSKIRAMQTYVALVQTLDASFKSETGMPLNKMHMVNNAYSKSSSVVSPSKHSDLSEPLKPAPNSSPSAFLLTVVAGLAVSAIGVCGFLMSTLSPTALTFLMLIVAGLMDGHRGGFAALLDANGLIALYPNIMQRILLDKTLVEVILEGTIMTRIRNFMTEVYPLIYCKTEEDRLEVLSNMSDRTRKLMTTRGVVNLLPAWQQRLTLSSQEYNRQQTKLHSTEAFRPAVDVQPDGQRRPNESKPRLEQQVKLASKLLTRSIQDRASAWILNSVNPQICKGLSLALAGSVLFRLRSNAQHRRALLSYFSHKSFASSAIGAVVFAVFAILHQLARRYHLRRQLQLQVQHRK
eukprot:CAMPEP_0171567684 /NCGR_PEP_ID=MMETSP0961-20121227/1305_1 /TAXON_ID=87120 /ORGANISM="Aurantiochytrium limacinum, Strain ATCCMYA-1381" /LENGTH=431 /DNA_ID=CAMNT_0012121649 /DNA_START=370 /DNA_END=1666 /DNA_ORIENTATION=+